MPDQETNTSVLQNWLVRIPIRMQSTLLLGLRGPDGDTCSNIKEWTRWLRGHAFKPGNPDNVRQFMNENLPLMLVEKSPLAQELYRQSQHYYSHLMHAVQVIAMRHPDIGISRHADAMYIAMAEAMHLTPETPSQFEERLGTRQWPGGDQPDTLADALGMISDGMAASRDGGE